MRPLFRNISGELARSLCERGKRHRFRENGEIFAAGTSAAYLPIVLTGSVKMIHFLEPGKEVIIGIFSEGEMFAVPPVIDGGKYPATAIAMEVSEVLMIDRLDFPDLLKGSTELSFAVISWMCEMLREKSAMIQNLATSSPEHRVGQVIMKLAEADISDGPAKITLRRQDIARMAGLTTETTIRAVRRLADKELITIIRGKIYLKTAEPLSKYLRN